MKTNIQNKYKSYCSICHYTMHINEIVTYEKKDAWKVGRSTHLDCIKALVDNTQREIDPKYINLYGQIDKKKLKRTLARQSLAGHSQSEAHQL